MKMKDWNGKDIEIVVSKGGVIALANPYANLITNGVEPWPPSEIVQKLYQSRQKRAFADDQQEMLNKFLGYYSDLQSIHSEDAITWSVFGTISCAETTIRNKWINDFFEMIGIKVESIKNSEIFLWRRIPHPDTLVSGGPEIDFGIYTEHTIIFGEAKWLSSVDVAQGKNKDKDQIQLRMEFLNNYGKRIFPSVQQMIVLGIGLKNDVVKTEQKGNIKCVGTTWDDVCSISSHPLAEELKRYLEWKKRNSKYKNG